MSRPVLLDLYCGAGGAAMGYHRAGFDVVGVDHVEQPRYPFRFIRADATTFPLDGFDAIHASPPCHDHSTLAALHSKRDTGWMLATTVARLAGHGRPWIVENVEHAAFPLDVWRVMLCGSAFGLRLRRHRWFASNLMFLVPTCDHLLLRSMGGAVGVYGNGGGDQNTLRSDGKRRAYKGTAAEARAAMGIEWMTRPELSQAIPPVYTELLGARLLEALTEPETVRGP